MCGGAEWGAKCAQVSGTRGLLSGSSDFAKGKVVAVRAGERVVAGLERKHAVKAHAGRPAPDDYIAVLEEHALRRVGTLKTAEQEDALEPERDGDDGLVHVNLMAVLVQPKPGARLIAVDVAGIRPEAGKAGANRAANGEVQE